MKKLMMSAVVLLPLVVLMILLISGTIIGKTTHLYVEALAFPNNETLVLVMDDENNPPSEQLEVNIYPSAATNKSLKYSSADEKVVSISDNGVVTAVDYGKTTITVTSVENDAVSVTRDVLVTDNKIHRLEIANYSARIYNCLGSNQQLLVNVFPNIYDESVGVPPVYVLEFHSSNSNVIHAAQDGVLTPVSVGEATITVSIKGDASVESAVTKTIKVVNPLESVNFVNSGDGAAITMAGTEAVFPAVKLNDGADESIIYTSSNPTVATVDETGHIYFASAGRVTITASARDELGNVESISKVYTCTKNYYLGNLFPQERYTVDYDEVMGTGGGILPITISENPEGARQEIIEVTFNRDDVVAFDYQTKTFTLIGDENKLGEVVVTMRARKYSIESDTIEEFCTDSCLINIERNVQSIEINFDQLTDNIVNYPTVNILADFADYIKITPSVHTNKFSYEVTTGGAVVDADGILRFTSQSTATVKITAINNTSNPASASITIIYSKAEAGDVRLFYNGAESQEENLNLKIYDDENKEKGIVVFTNLPNGVDADSLSYSILSGEGTVLSLEKDGDTVRIVPLKGGCGTVAITANVSDARSRTTKTWLVNIYVDRQVDQIILTPTADVTTSLKSYPYKVVVLPEDAMVGKELHVSDAASPIAAATYIGSLEFSAQGSQTITAFVSYAGSSNAIGGTTVSRTVFSSFGTLIEHPKVTCEDTATELSATETNEFTLNDVNESIRFIIDTSSFSPTDYVLKASDISVSVNTNYISYTISDDGTTITLIGVNGCKDEPVTITVKNKTFILKGTVVAKAHYLKVIYGDIAFVSGNGNYLTFADAITLKVTPERKDKKTVTEDAILHWTYGLTGADCAIGDVKVMLKNSNNSNANIITFTYGELTFVVNLQKVNAVSDFGIQAFYTDGQTNALDPITSMASQTEEIYYKFPSRIQNQFTLQIILPDNVIGGFGTDTTANGLFAKTFNIRNFGDWEVSYDPFNARITLVATTKTERAITVSHGSICQNITFGFVDIQGIESLGFSMAKEDVYLGYQQVRVFAKNSYYDGKTVSYFKIPLTVQGTLRYLNFKIERYVNDAKQGVITTQDGYSVVTRDATYTIKRRLGEDNAEYGLFDSNGSDVSDSGLTWVDVFSEPGYARIYFGDFAGLSESDVYNDYFGNFGEQENWKQYTQAVDDGSGRTVIPSDNAGAFMRIEANDGIAGSSVTPWHYNFNVLDENEEDVLNENGEVVQCKKLVNIETAASYLARPNGRVVLQHSLYGRGERKDAKGNVLPDDKYTLEKIIGVEACEDKGSGKYNYVFAWWDLNALQKELIYGNGFQVNFETFNRQVINTYAGKPEAEWNRDVLSDEKRTSAGENNLIFGSFINATIKGANVNEEGRNDKEVYSINIVARDYWNTPWSTNHFYYSNILCWRKGLDIWGGNTAYVKNVTMRYMPEFGIKIGGDATGYIENIVIAECSMAIRTRDDTAKVYFKGYQDIFCYSVPDDLLSAVVAENLVDTVRKLKLMEDTLQSVYNYSEWFGSDGGASTSNYRYINVAILCDNGGAANRKMYFWDESTHGYKERLNTCNSGELRQGATKSVSFPISFQMAIWSYDNLNSTDGGKAVFEKGGLFGKTTDTSSRPDWNKLFTDERYIRLLCEFKTKDGNTLVSNGEHLQWHFNRSYRDSALVGAKGWHYEDHTTNLKQSLVDVTWKDASNKTYNANDYINADITTRKNSKRARVPFAAQQKFAEFVLPRTKFE